MIPDTAEGTVLTYDLMAAHPNWFLDPLDFSAPNRTGVTNESDNASRKPAYPEELYPPLDSKFGFAKNGHGTSQSPYQSDDEDLTRLRCTFCRKAFNAEAKGGDVTRVWRKHVVEQHNVALNLTISSSGDSEMAVKQEETELSKYFCAARDLIEVALNFIIRV